MNRCTCGVCWGGGGRYAEEECSYKLHLRMLENVLTAGTILFLISVQCVRF
jgi:hypothetical protein